MKNLIIKTTAITIASVVSLLAIVFGTLCVFSPKTVAKGFDLIGSKNASVFFYQKQYDKTKAIDDLIVLVDIAYSNEQDESLEKSLSQLISHSEFDNYCNQKDQSENADSISKFSTKEYYLGFYVKTLIKNNKFNKALSVANDYVSENGYSQYNPYSIIVSDCMEDLSSEQKAALKKSISDCKCQDQDQENYKNNHLNKFN